MHGDTERAHMHTTIVFQECTKMLFSGLARKEDAIQNYLYAKTIGKRTEGKTRLHNTNSVKGSLEMILTLAIHLLLNRPNCICTYLRANQRHCQCFIRHTEQFLTEMCCMTDSKARVAEPSLFQGLASSQAREATRRATRCFFLQIVSTRSRARKSAGLS